MDDHVLRVIRSIGLPNYKEGNSNLEESPHCFHVAVLNKVGLFYLESLDRFGKVRAQKDFCRLRERFRKTRNLARFLGVVLGRSGVSYAIFKTLKPFQFSAKDVDVLVESHEDFAKAVRALKNEGFRCKAGDLFSLTLFREDFGINVDLHLEISASNLPYMDKSVLFGTHVIDREFDGEIVRSLDACAEVVVIACHGLYKEQMFTLADFYSVVLWCKEIDVDELCELAERSGSEIAVSLLFSWVDKLVKEIFKIRMPVIDQVLARLDSHPILNIALRGGFRFPFKLSKASVALSFSNKFLRDPRLRSGLLRGLLSSFSEHQLRVFLKHFGREGY
jgi:hypothetical protein